METFSYRKSRIWEMKEDKYTKSVAKNQVYAIVHMRDIRKNVLPKFIKLCMETPCLWAVYKSGTGTRGRGHRDAYVGTWDLGTRDEGLEDIKYGTWGRVGRGRQKQGHGGRGM